MRSQKVIFQKSQKLLTENLYEKPPIQNIQWLSFNFNGGLCKRRTGFCPCRAPCPGDKQFLWFLKSDLLRFHLILLLFYSTKRLSFEMCLVRSTMATMCPNMIHLMLWILVSVALKKWCFFWRSVYIHCSHDIEVVEPCNTVCQTTPVQHCQLLGPCPNNLLVWGQQNWLITSLTGN